MAYDCFISYASPDLPSAEILYDRLVAARFTVWFDKARLRPGFNWHQEIEDACEQSRILLPVLTPRWKLSEWTRYETYGAEAAIPLLVEGAWREVATPPLERYQCNALPLSGAAEPDWERLFGAVRELLLTNAPRKAERVAHLRYRPNPHFVGREETLNEIHEKLFTNPTAALTQGHVEAITALGGIGKTTLARQYAEKFWRCYRQMLWVDCRKSLESEFAALHDLLRPEPAYAALKDTDKAAWVRWELSQAAQRPSRLLILDNAEDEESVAAWIPKTGNCHTIITSRFTGWSPGIEVCPVWVLEPGPARDLLLRRSGRTEANAKTEECDAVARKLEYLPLALEQAAAYVGEQGPGYQFGDYLRMYAVHERKFLAQKTRGSTEYPDSVFLTWRATIDKLPLGARAMLRLCSFLASAPIPAAMLIAGVGIVVEQAKRIADELGLPPDRDLDSAGDFEIEQWKAALATYSMVKLQAEQSFSVHGLVQAVERHHVAAETRARLVEHAVELVVAWAPLEGGKSEHWSAWRTLLPHAQYLWHWQQADESVTPSTAFLTGFGYFLQSQAEYTEAEAVLRSALKVSEQRHGAKSVEVARSLKDLANLLLDLNQYQEAEQLYKRALTIREVEQCHDHIEEAKILIGLGVVHYSVGRYSNSEVAYRQALNIYETSGKSDDDGLAIVLSNLARLYSDQGKEKEAGQLQSRALAIAEKIHGPDHPAVAVHLSTLALIYHVQNKLTDAEQIYLRDLAIKVKWLGKHHPDTAAILFNLASVHYDKGEYDDAEKLLKEALKIQEVALGPNSQRIGLCLNDLAILYKQQGRYSEAEEMYRRALAIYESVRPQHPDVAATLSNLGKLREAQGQPEQAADFYGRALEMFENTIGLGYPKFLTTLYNLAKLHMDRQKWREAEPLFERELVLTEARWGPEHPTLAECLADLARIYMEQGKNVEAEPLLHRALKITSTSRGSDNQDVAYLLNELAVLFSRQGRYGESEAALIRSRTIWENTLGRDHPNVLLSLTTLGHVYLNQERYAEAETLGRQVLALQESKLGPDHAELVPALNGLAVTLQRLGNYAEAETLSSRAVRICDDPAKSATPGNASGSLNNLGMSLVCQGRLAEAQQPLVRATVLDPRSPYPHYWLAKLCQSRGNPADAALEAAEWRQYLELGAPDEARRKEAIGRLTELLGADAVAQVLNRSLPGKDSAPLAGA